jgi:hypothetical protein
MAQKPITRDFCVTSPQTHHAEVEWIRKRLGKKDHNEFGIATYEVPPGSFSGTNYGTQLADAAYQMKFRLGYPDKSIDAAYGQTLDAYLIGNKPLPEDYKKRKADRKGVTAPHSKYWDDGSSSIEQIRSEAVKRALNKVGVKESPPDSNKCFASDWYGMIGPWCAMFVTWAYDPCGCEATKQGSRWAYVPYIVSDAKAGRNSLKVVTGDPIKGDLACFDWDNDGEHDHVGIITANAKRGGAIPTVEGNTSASGSQSNGGQVLKKTRYVRSGEIKTIVRILS